MSARVRAKHSRRERPGRVADLRMQAITQLLGFPDRGSGTRANLEQYLREVDVENTEHMSYQRDFDEELECRPTYEQLSHERVGDEAGKNILVLHWPQRPENRREAAACALGLCLRSRPHPRPA